jgi:arabinogalactan oligomer/maltooligosaccharide transport system substrate-binding protein
MKSWKKTVLASATLGAAVLTLAACGSSDKSSDTASDSGSAKDVTIKVWVSTDQKKGYEDLVKSFEKEHSNVTVDMVEMSDDKAQENVKKDPSVAADVFTLPHDQIGQLVESKVLQEVPEAQAKSIESDNIANAVAAAKYKGKLYAFPRAIETKVLYYNKSKVSDSDAKKYETLATADHKFGANLEAVNGYDWAPLFYSVGDTLYGKDGSTVDGTDWNNEAGVNVMKWIAAQKTNPGFMNVTDDTMSKFKSGEITSFESGPWDLAAAQEAIGEDNLGVAVYPTINIGGEDVQQQAFMGVKVVAVNQAPADGDEDRIVAAYQFAEYITGEAAQESVYKSLNLIPSNAKAQEKAKDSDITKAVLAMSEKGFSTPMPNLPEMSNFWTAAGALLSGPYKGEFPESEYQAKLDQAVKDFAGSN